MGYGGCRILTRSILPPCDLDELLDITDFLGLFCVTFNIVSIIQVKNWNSSPWRTVILRGMIYFWSVMDELDGEKIVYFISAELYSSVCPRSAFMFMFESCQDSTTFPGPQLYLGPGKLSIRSLYPPKFQIFALKGAKISG
jgi:hypothetical protein